jgi:hypothetical protein
MSSAATAADSPDSAGAVADAVERWQTAPRLAFVDAYLAAIAARQRRLVFTKNVAELSAQGVTVVNPLPG